MRDLGSGAGGAFGSGRFGGCIGAVEGFAHGVGEGRERSVVNGGFGDEDIGAGRSRVDLIKKERTQEPLGAVASDGVADFFAGDKSDTVLRRVFAKKKDKIGGVPRRVGTAIDRVKFARGAEAVEVF